MTGVIKSIGGLALQIAFDAGGMALVLARVLRHLAPPRFDRAELVRALGAFGQGSLPIVAVTAGFTGVIMVLQGAAAVEQFQVTNFVGWYTGFATFREVGPILIGLMFSGRVGANHTSELATMKVSEQIDALRVLALDPFEILIVPRTLAMIAALAGLVVFGDLIAVLSGALGARILLGLDFRAFFASLVDRLGPNDFLIGIEKALLYGLVVAVVSTHFGLTARGGSAGVGRAVNAQVVACAVGLFLADYLLTSVVR